MRSEAQKRRAATPQHKRSARRRAANRSRILLAVLGGLSLFIGVVLAGLALFKGRVWGDPAWWMSAGYAGFGLLLLLIRAVMERVRRKNRQGGVLLIVLILLGLLASLVIHLQHQTRIAQRTDQHLLQQSRLRAALIDEAFTRLQELVEDEDANVDHLEKEWMTTREWDRPDGITTMSRVIDLNRYLDFNNLVAPGAYPATDQAERMLAAAMIQTGDFAPDDRLVALTDWIDADDQGIRESDFYLALNPPYPTPNTWLQSWSELLYVHAFEPEHFMRRPLDTINRPFSANLIDLVTVIPGPREQPILVNLNTASRGVLDAIFGTENDHISRYILMRRADTPLQNIDALLAYMDPDLFNTVRPFIGVRGTHFLVTVDAVEKGIHAGLHAIAHREESGEVNVIQWVM